MAVDPPAGYLHAAYAGSLAGLGRRRLLAGCGGWIIERTIPNSNRRDAMGCYPVFCCTDWNALPDDLDRLTSELVSLVIVTDPFGPLDEAGLRGMFDLVRPFKEHLLADLSQPLEKIVSRHRLQLGRKALAAVTVEIAAQPEHLVDDWLELYGGLARRRRLSGVQGLSREALLQLLAVPGVTVLRASAQGCTVGMHIEVVQGEVVYGHLAAYSAEGYRLGASHALHVWEIEHFRGRARWIDWGGVAGIDPDRRDGLVTFKEGFSNTRRPVYLCGRIFDRPAYHALQSATGTLASAYIPAYRDGEFA